MLSTEVDEALRGIGSTEIAIGVPTYNNAETVGHVVSALREGLAKHFPGSTACLLVSDAGSTDATPELVAAVEWAGPRVVTRHAVAPSERAALPYHGLPGRADAQRTVFEAARRLKARACAITGADVVAFEPDCVEGLLRPVLEDGCDYVTPVYQRHRYEGTLTQMLIYPLMRALFGKCVRQPLGGPIALSARLLTDPAVQELAATDATGATRQGLDLWLVAIASAAPFVLRQAWVGSGQTHSPGRPGDLATVLAQAVGGLFALVEPTADAWTAVRHTEAVPVVGGPASEGRAAADAGGAVDVNVAGMIRAFRLGVRDLLPIWHQVLGPDVLGEVLALESVHDEAWSFPHDLWARVVGDFALGYHFRVVYREHLLRSLVPLYLGRTGAFVRETRERGAAETEAWIERGCRAFEAQKPSLLVRWQ